MAKNTKEQNLGFIKITKKISYLSLLFAVWILIKLGNFGIDFFFVCIKLFKKTLFFILKIILFPFWIVKKTALFLYAFLLSPFYFIRALFRSKKRGRPRKQPLLKFVLKKNKKTLNRVFPSPLRIVLGLSVLLIGFFVYSFVLIILAHDLPSPQNITKLESPVTTEFYDRNGTLLYRLYEGKNRTPVELSDIPQTLINATIAMEDKNFYSHPGVDFYGVARAIGAFVQEREVQGGSTITQQLIKNTLLTPERTLERKSKEIVLAFWTERLFSKQDILKMYFNEVPYGGPAWGIAAAAQTYFDKEVKDLTLAESTFLAGLPASPTTYSPYGTNPGLGKLRQKEVLRRMVEDRYINQEEADKAYAEELEIKSPIISIKAPHFVMYVRSLLAQKYGEKMVSQGGLRVYTSLDLNLQEMAENVVADEVSKLGNLQVGNGAAMITDAKTGHIIAMVGSKNYWDPAGGNFNVTIANRQPGSSIKPVTYATGFKQGYSPGNTLLDTPVTFKNEWESYSPVNYDGRFHGPVTIRTALGSSYNIPAVKMQAIVGTDNLIQTAKDLGITTFTDPNRYGLSLTLGGGEVKLIDMMAVYGTFSQNGVKHDSQPIIKLTDSKGNIIEDNTNPEGEKAIPSGVAYMITDILADNRARTPAFGTNSQLNIPGHQVAVKTGTTDNKRDNWTFGYTPEYVVGVWVGNNDNTPMHPSLTSGVTGAAPIWNRIMTEILSEKTPIAFTKPDDIAQGVVDGHRDIVMSGTPTKSIIGQGRRNVRDEKENKDKEVITFTDPFSTYQTDPNSQPPTP